jgi:hypothetical protein
MELCKFPPWPPAPALAARTSPVAVKQPPRTSEGGPAEHNPSAQAPGDGAAWQRHVGVGVRRLGYCRAERCHRGEPVGVQKWT